ncbi:MAG: ATP-binding cassette domain-containing protein [Candidatus Adiutrix sp.]|jgi:sulfate transport system ATP-binding protein|nr:ATP-binding cassette domain-containing protein [Candidatus Adiutrix sp.]
MYVELKGINKRFQDVPASREVSFGLRQGVLAALLGPSGSGKTTILRMIAGLEHPDSGDILIDGLRINEVEPSRRGIGFVFQNYALFRHMNVYDNIAFGLSVKKERPEAIRDKVGGLLELIGLAGLERRFPAQLSGGQKQRVAFARALAPDPRLLLLDEPFAAIDAKVRRELRSWLREMISRLGITSIFVTHDQDEAIEVADEILVTNLGRVEQKGSPLSLYKAPATPFVAKFIGESTLIDDVGALNGFEAAPPGATGAVRPEFIKIFTLSESVQYEGSAEDAVVERLAFRGDSLEVWLKCKGMTLPARYSLEKRPLAVGEPVKALIYRLYAFEDDRVRLFNNSRLGDHPLGYSYSI